jgi:hypothetical protein
MCSGFHGMKREEQDRAEVGGGEGEMVEVAGRRSGGNRGFHRKLGCGLCGPHRRRLSGIIGEGDLHVGKGWETLT